MVEYSQSNQQIHHNGPPLVLIEGITAEDLRQQMKDDYYPNNQLVQSRFEAAKVGLEHWRLHTVPAIVALGGTAVTWLRHNHQNHR